ncbi:MAG: hypothetical protein N2595_01550 [bacterium]|nr:hypothetical protein [bacterium]
MVAGEKVDHTASATLERRCGQAWRGWVAHVVALAVFLLLTLWHFLPVLPVLTTHAPTGGTFDFYNFTAAPLTVARALLRTPWRFWRGDRPYPEPFACTLHQVDYPYALTYYALYQILGNPLLIFNVIAMMLYVANAWCVYALVRRWSGQWLAGVFGGVMGAFYGYSFFCMELDIQVMYISALTLLAWLSWLERGGVLRLGLFFGAAALKTTTPDYQAVFLVVLLGVAVPLGFIAYPERWQREWQRFVVASVVFILLMLPFVYPYVRVLRRYPGHGWRGIMFVNVSMMTWEAWWSVWRDFWHHITHVRTQSSPDPSFFVWPGAVWQLCGTAGVVRALLAPFVYGRRGWLRWALLLAGAVALCLAFTPQIGLGSFGRLSRLYVDPPVLAVVRAPRAFLFSLHLCVTVLAGVALGDLLRAAGRWRVVSVVASVGVAVLSVLFSLENTVRLRSLTRYDELRNPPPVYQWLSEQSYPSPMIEFPYRPTFFDFNIKGALGALADQPTAKGRSRYVIPLPFFLEEVSGLALTARAAFVSASPYHLWVQEGAGEVERQVVEVCSDLRYVTNFGGTMVFRNPAPGKTAPVSVVVTQRYEVSLPHVIYTVSVDFCTTALFCFVPEGARRFTATVRVLDEARRRLAQLRVREELPFVLKGPKFEVGLELCYERARGRLTGRLLRPGVWRIAKAPEARARFSDEAMRAARWLDISVERAGGGRAALCVPIVALPPRWPYQFGLPVSYAYQAGGFDTMERDDRPFQRSIGRQSVVCLPGPGYDARALVVTLRSAVPFVKEGVDVGIVLNDIVLGTVRVSNSWETYTFTVPDGAWREINWLSFTYPRTYVPCVTQGGGDDKPRCVAVSEITVRERRGDGVGLGKHVEATQASQAVTGSERNLVVNGTFGEGLLHWRPWRDESITNTLWVIGGEDGSALRMANPRGTLAGVQQLVRVHSGTVYRLRARARSVTDSAEQLFGGRVAVWLPPQPEPQLVWLYSDGSWREQVTMFTSRVSGVACVYVHLGYGNVATTGEFSHVRLEECGDE